MTRTLGPGKLVIATHNAGKLREISALLEPYGMECLSAGSLGLPEPEETGTTFVENALLKARARRRHRASSRWPTTAGCRSRRWTVGPAFTPPTGRSANGSKANAGRDWYLAMGKVEGLLSAAWAGCRPFGGVPLRAGDRLARRRRTPSTKGARTDR